MKCDYCDKKIYTLWIDRKTKKEFSLCTDHLPKPAETELPGSPFYGLKPAPVPLSGDEK